MSVRNIDISQAQPDLIRDDDALFMLVTSASFVESGSDIYTGNLLERFAGDREVSEWLSQHWEPEELSHGRALKAYVQRVWPELDWDAAYADFFADYSRLCTQEELEPTCCQELAARCIVEMGTTTYYQALNEACAEPVLRDLAWQIRSDEVQHFKHFYAYFVRYRAETGLGRLRVLAAIARRAVELRSEDGNIALAHAARWRRRSRPSGSSGPSEAELMRHAYGRLKRHIPIDLAVRMLLKPLQLLPLVERALTPSLAALGRNVLLR